MILFRGLSIAAFWYIVCVLETPLFFDIHLYLEDECALAKNLILDMFDIYIEHPLYYLTLGIVAILFYALGKIFDSSFSIISVVGLTGAASYFFFFS